MTPKEVVYSADGRGGSVQYVIDGRNVYFSGITSPSTSMSTINAAEDVIRAICNDAEILCSDFVFYDIQTQAGYQKPPGYYMVDRLVLSTAGGIAVSNWIPTARWELPSTFDMRTDLVNAIPADQRQGMLELGRKEQQSLPGIPDRVLALFKPLIGNIQFD